VKKKPQNKTMPSPAMASCDGMYVMQSAMKEDVCVGSALRVLSIDVGMKNLAYCLFDFNATGEIKTPESIMKMATIVAWDTVNLCDGPTAVEKPAAITCSAVGCKFTAKFAHSATYADGNPLSNYYCTRHANASGHKMPLPVPIKSLKKMTLEELKSFSGEYLSSPLPEKCEKSKVKLLQHLNAVIAAEYLVAVNSKPKVIAASSLDLITIGRNMHRQFDALPHLVSGIDVVIIENQLSTLATRMKTLQGMITQYFIMRGVPDIRFISATNKLKLFDQKKEGEGGDKGDKGDKGEDCYADRKKRSIDITRSLLSTQSTQSTQSTRFATHKKKDDLADCFLQGVWWLSGNYVPSIAPRTPPSGTLQGTAHVYLQCQG
jgi:hypothetical protein